MKIFITFLIGDIKNITRDSMLLGAMLAPIVLALFIKLSISYFSEFSTGMFPFYIEHHYPFIMSFVILLSPFMLGVMAGLMILEEMDDNILSYIAVTPVSKSGYLLYRLIVPMLISTILTIFIIGYTGLVDFTISILPVVLMAALITPIMALFLAGFANNKVEGLAFGKAMGLILIVPVLTYIAESNWLFLLSIFPTFWISEAFMKSYEMTLESNIFILIGFCVQGIYIYVLFKLFNRKST
ncbi:ABC transporter permease [Bacillus atrophaeus]|uniref:ABC transporter permease n=1 Tax=Bacillus atrophaeus TaxID=1452 RepID=UPI003873625D